MTPPTVPPPLVPLRAPHHVELRARLAGAGARVIARALAEQYVDPFWRARYGEAAERRGTEDGRFHLAYLDQALAANDPGILEHYARWLQPILTSRGMCTRHIVEHFERLGRAISAEGWTDGPVIASAIETLVGALAYGADVAAGAARALQERTVALVGAAVPVIAALHPAQASHATASLVILASYAADAVALGGPATLVAHARWLVGDSIAGGLAPTYVHDQLVALRAALGDVLSAAVGVGAAAVLDAAIAAT